MSNKRSRFDKSVLIRYAVFFSCSEFNRNSTQIGLRIQFLPSYCQALPFSLTEVTQIRKKFTSNSSLIVNPIQAGGGHNVPPTGFCIAVLKRLAVGS